MSLSAYRRPAFTRRWTRVGVETIPFLIGALLIVYPLATLGAKVVQGGTAALDRFVHHHDLAGTLLTTAGLSLASTLIALVLGTSLALAAMSARSRFFVLIPLLPLVAPPVSKIVGWMFLLSPSVGYVNQMIRSLPWMDRENGPINVYSVTWIIIITGIDLTSFVYLYALSSLRRLSNSYDEAATVFGARGPARLWKVKLPLLRGTLLGAGLVTFLLGLGQFAAPLLLGFRQGVSVLATEMFRQTQSFPIDYSLIGLLGAPLVLFAAVALIVQAKLRGTDLGLMDSNAGPEGQHRNTKRVWPPRLAISVFGLLTLAVPLLAVAYTAFQPYWTGDIQFDNFTLANIRDVVFDTPDTTKAIRNSLILALITLVTTIPFSITMAYVMSKGKSKIVRSATQLLSSVPLAMPAIVLGLAFLFTVTRPPFHFYGTLAAYFFVYTALMLPHSVRAISTGLIAIGDDYDDAAKVFGASAPQRLVRITAPLLRPFVASAALIIFILVSEEFSASMMVGSPGTPVMGIALYNYWQSGLYPQVAVMALVMVMVTAIGVFLLLLSSIEKNEAMFSAAGP